MSQLNNDLIVEYMEHILSIDAPDSPAYLNL
jgi:hypothetical protein